MPVTVAFVSARWPSESLPFRDELVESVIDDANDELLDKIPDLDALIASGRLAEKRVDRFIRKAVIGALQNIEGLKSESEGDFSLSRYGDGFVWYRQSDIDALLGRGQSTVVETIRTSLPCGWQ